MKKYRLFRMIKSKHKSSEKAFQKVAKRYDEDYNLISDKDIDKMQIKGYIVNEWDDIFPCFSKSWKDNKKYKYKFGKNRKTIRKSYCEGEC